MPKMVKIGPNPAYKPAKGDEQAFSAVKAAGEKTVSYVTAMEAVRNSGGMYRIVPEASAVAAPAVAVRMPEEMTRDELVLTAIQLGIDTTKKQMKKAELVKAIRLQMDSIQLLDDDEGETGAE